MELQKCSNIEKAQKNAYKYLGITATLSESTRKDQKYMIKNDEDKWVHFG